MAGNISDYEAASMLKHAYGVATYTPSATYEVGLSLEPPGDDGAGIDEPDAASYARVEHNSWKAHGDRGVANDGVIQFPQPEHSWGTPGYWFIVDGDENFRAWGPLADPQAIDDTSPAPKFADGALTIEADATA